MYSAKIHQGSQWKPEELLMS